MPRSGNLRQAADVVNVIDFVAFEDCQNIVTTPAVVSKGTPGIMILRPTAGLDMSAADI